MSEENRPFDLYWLGAQGDCEGSKLNNLPVVANTKLAIGVTQRQLAFGERPKRVFIFAEYEPFLKRLFGGRSLLQVVDLDLAPSPGTGFVAKSEPWPLPPPIGAKGSQRYVCSLDEQARGVKTKIISVNTKTYIDESISGRPEVRVGGPAILGFDALAEVKPQSRTRLTATVIAGLDPWFDIDVLTLSNGTLEKYLLYYLRDVAEQLSVDEADLRKQFNDLYAPLLERRPGYENDLEIEIEPREMWLEAASSESLTIRLSTRSRANQLIVIRLTEKHTSLECYSDVIEVFSPQDTVNVSSVIFPTHPLGQTDLMLPKTLIRDPEA